jgi:hypothetical protein
VVAYLQLTSPVQRLTGENLERWLPLMREAAQTLSQLLYGEGWAEVTRHPGPRHVAVDDAASRSAAAESRRGSRGRRYRAI